MEFLKLSSLKIFICCLSFLTISACSLFDPYIDRRRNPGTQDLRRLYTGPSQPGKPVICYNSFITNDDALQQMADTECIEQKTGNHAVFMKKTYFDGKLLLPHHAHYKCVWDSSALKGK